VVREARVIVWNYTKPNPFQDMNIYILAVPVLALISGWIILYYREYYAER
jgi:hypothetical protein